jgi:hypothetical protein
VKERESNQGKKEQNNHRRRKHTKKEVKERLGTQTNIVNSETGIDSPPPHKVRVVVAELT